MINKVTLIGEQEMYEKGMSIHEIHEKTGTPLSTIRFRLKKLGILRSQADGVRLSELRGRNPHKGNSNPMREETKEKLSKAQLKRGEEKAIGFRYKQNGYMEFTRGPYKGKQVHTVTMEKYLGRKLTKSETIHHIDGNRSNNHISNLSVMCRSSHASLHAKNTNRTRNDKGQFI